MIFRMFKKGQAGLAYCLGKEGNGLDVRNPVVVAGNPEQAFRLIGASNHSNPYTSLVLSYEREISDEEAARDISSFEAALLPGLRAGLDYECVWIKHKEHPKRPGDAEAGPH